MYILQLSDYQSTWFYLLYFLQNEKNVILAFFKCVFFFQT